MNGLVSISKFNALRFPSDPQPATKLWRWCREGKLPARKVGGEWFVDLDAFDKVEQKQAHTGVVSRVVDRLRLA